MPDTDTSTSVPPIPEATTKPPQHVLDSILSEITSLKEHAKRLDSDLKVREASIAGDRNQWTNLKAKIESMENWLKKHL